MTDIEKAIEVLTRKINYLQNVIDEANDANYTKGIHISSIYGQIIGYTDSRRILQIILQDSIIEKTSCTEQP